MSCAIDWRPTGPSDAGTASGNPNDGEVFGSEAGSQTEADGGILDNPDSGDAAAALSEAGVLVDATATVTICGSGVCLHGGGCAGDGQHCVCVQGFEGDQCQTDVDECKLPTGGNPCPDAFPCVDAPGGFTCAGQLADFPLPGLVRGPNDFETNAAGTTVRDHATGLMWLQKPDDTNLSNLSFAIDACKSADPESPGAYRLPSILEFATLFDENNFPALHPIFGTMPSGRYWTGNPSLLSNWSWDTSTGRLSDGNADTFLSVLYTRCVRTFEPHFQGYPDARFRVAQDANTLTDQRSQLTWQWSVPATQVSFAAASALCDGAGAGYRLPSLLELLSTLDHSARASVASASYGDALGPTWTSVRSAGSASQHLAVDTRAGTLQALDDSSAAALVRCVHHTVTP